MNYPLYIHIPYCLSKCEYCDFFSVPIGDLILSGGQGRKRGAGRTRDCARIVPDEYVTALCNEIRYRKEKYNAEKWSTIYIGGGTPSLLSACQINKITECVLQDAAQDVEFTMEVNPADVSADFLRCLSDCGVNRLSLGVQAFDDDSLSCVKRRSAAHDVEKSLECVKSHWNGEFSADLISALPFQTEKSFVSGLKRLLDYKPHHISLYSLTIEEETPLFKRIASKEIPYNYDEADALWLLGKETLEKNGWRAYEVSNFYNEEIGRPCVHNMAYWNMHSYIGAGSGGTGSLYGGKSIRYTNSRNIAAYIDFWSNWRGVGDEGDSYCGQYVRGVLSPIDESVSNAVTYREIALPQDVELLEKSDEELEFFMMGLRLYEGICLEDFKSRFSKEIPRHYCTVMDTWKKKNLAEYYKKQGRTSFCLTREGILFLNEFLREMLVV